MTQTPEEEPFTMNVQAQARKTEMGVEVAAHSPAANVTVEIDLDHDPEYTYGLLAVMPRIINDQLTKMVEEGEDSEVSTP